MSSSCEGDGWSSRPAALLLTQPHAAPLTSAHTAAAAASSWLPLLRRLQAAEQRAPPAPPSGLELRLRLATRGPSASPKAEGSRMSAEGRPEKAPGSR